MITPWLHYHKPSVGAPLRLGVLVDADGRMEAWFDGLLKLIAQIPRVELVGAFTGPRAEVGDTPSLLRKLETTSLGGAQDAFALVPCGLATVGYESIAGANLDVLLRLSTTPIRGQCGGLARLGVWSVVLGEGGRRPPYWQEALSGADVLTGALVRHDDDVFERGRVLDRFAASSYASLHFTKAREAPLRTAVSMVGRALAKASCGEIAEPRNTVDFERKRATSNGEVIGFAARKLARSARLRFATRGKEYRWLAGIRRTGETQYREIANPTTGYFADPFVLAGPDGRQWLFVEEWVDAQQRGRLACMEIRRDGSLTESVVVLEKPYHLSYPHVFAHAGEVFLMPESCDNGTVQLFRATRFPWEWTLEAEPVRGLGLVDTTPLFLDGMWYFFTSTPFPPEEGYLFTSRKLDGEWSYHPANPIAVDVRWVRGAGAIRGMRRPAQDGSLGYGYAMSWNQIVKLTPREFEERTQVERVLPKWAPKLLGTHTWNGNESWEVIDGARFT